MLKADGFDSCVMGVTSGGTKLIYNYEACVALLCVRDGMSHEEAEEFMDYNVVGAYMGEETPEFFHIMTLEEIEEDFCCEEVLTVEEAGGRSIFRCEGCTDATDTSPCFLQIPSHDCEVPEDNCPYNQKAARPHWEKVTKATERMWFDGGKK